MLDYRAFTFLALYDEMNYRKTAEKLNMTQPGVTQHIHYLEKHYGVKLFEYDGRTLSKTKNAHRLKQYFDSINAEEVALRDSLVTTDTLRLTVGATKTIGEFIITPNVRAFLKKATNNLNLIIDNTENLLRLLQKSQLDFAIIEGIFDKSQYGYHLYKKEAFVGICAKKHPFAGKTVSLEDTFCQDIVVREPFSGTRNLLQNAIRDHGFSLDNFKRCASVSNFSVICDLVANNGFITFAYEPISHCRNDLATFNVADMQICGEFNFVYCNERIAKEKIAMMF